jgi:hypothetical protein
VQRFHGRQGHGPLTVFQLWPFFKEEKPRYLVAVKVAVNGFLESKTVKSNGIKVFKWDNMLKTNKKYLFFFI